MGEVNLAETIRRITEIHLTEHNGLLLGQAISAVGWVNGTVPNCDNIVELPMTDVAGAGFAVGCALVGRRPIFVLRFQDFIALNGSQIFNYAAKSKTLHGISAPVFLRCIASDGIGPVHSGVFHNIAMTYPGITVCAPMTPGEYREIWDYYCNDDNPMYVSEHRRSYTIEYEMENQVSENADITIFAISDARLNALLAAEMLRSKGKRVNIVHILWLKPLKIDRLVDTMNYSVKGLVVDSGFEICGASQSIAFELTKRTRKYIDALGITDNTKCLCNPLKNMTPSVEEIYMRAMEVINA